MGLGDILGRSSTLYVQRVGPSGAWLAPPGDEGPKALAVLLPRAEVPAGAREGDAIEAVVYLDDGGQPLASTQTPKLELGEVAFLRVVATTRFGAFVDWGLARDLLVPFDEQITEPYAGQMHPIGLYRDQSGRLAGTMRVSEMLAAPEGEFRAGEWVEGEAWRNEPGLGVFVIVERSFVGLLPEGEPHELTRGEAARFRVARVLPDGKIRLSLRGLRSEELEADADRVLATLGRPGTPRVGDRSSPEQIRALFGLTKKAFKRAAGRLLKRGEAELDGDGFLTARRARQPALMVDEDYSADDLVDLVAPLGDPEVALMTLELRAAVKAAFAEAAAGLEARERNLLRQHLLDGLTIDELGVLYRVPRVTAARWLARARERAWEATAQALRTRLPKAPPELDSLLAAVRTGLDLSLERVLAG